MQFMLSIIYSAVVVLAIFFVFQAFIGASKPSQAGFKHLDTIERAFQVASTEGVLIALQENEQIFLGYADENCKNKFTDVMGEREDLFSTCDDMLCYCYSFTSEDRPYALCRQRNLFEANISGHNPIRIYGRGLCLTATNDAFRFRLDPTKDPTQVWLERIADGGP